LAEKMELSPLCEGHGWIGASGEKKYGAEAVIASFDLRDLPKPSMRDIWMADRPIAEGVRKWREKRIEWLDHVEWTRKWLKECEDNTISEWKIERNIHGRPK
jgi:hypothetical protein